MTWLIIKAIFLSVLIISNIIIGVLFVRGTIKAGKFEGVMLCVMFSMLLLEDVLNIVLEILQG